MGRKKAILKDEEPVEKVVEKRTLRLVHVNNVDKFKALGWMPVSEEKSKHVYNNSLGCKIYTTDLILMEK